MTAKRSALSWSVCLITVAGLAVDAYVHLRLAPTQPPSYQGHLGQDTLFYLEGAVSIAAALLVLTRARWAYVVAILVAGTAVGAVVLYRYVDVGALGPVPDLYEPIWYPQKTWSASGEAVALAAAVIGVVLPRVRPRPAQIAGWRSRPTTVAGRGGEPTAGRHATRRQ